MRTDAGIQQALPQNRAVRPPLGSRSTCPPDDQLPSAPNNRSQYHHQKMVASFSRTMLTKLKPGHTFLGFGSLFFFREASSNHRRT